MHSYQIIWVGDKNGQNPCQCKWAVVAVVAAAVVAAATATASGQGTQDVVAAGVVLFVRGGDGEVGLIFGAVVKGGGCIG